MSVNRCSLCGGKLDSSKVCTECGMDNKKNDSHYRLNENLVIEPGHAGQQNTGRKSGAGFPEGQGADRRRSESGWESGSRKQSTSGTAPQRGFAGQSEPRSPYPYRKQYGWPPNKTSHRTEGGNAAGKVVFIIFLLAVIGITAAGFMEDSREASENDYSVDAGGILDEDIDLEMLGEAEVNEDGSYTIYSADGGHSADITMMEGQIYCYSSEGYFSSMQEDTSGEDNFLYQYSFDVFTSLEEAEEVYMNDSWAEEYSEEVTVSEAQEMEVEGRTVYWAQLDYVMNGIANREIHLWTQVGDILFTIELDNYAYSEGTAPSGTVEMLAEALRNVELS